MISGRPQGQCVLRGRHGRAEKTAKISIMAIHRAKGGL